MRRATRAVWADRVAQWERSGMTAEAFAARAGVNHRTLMFWKWQLKTTSHATPPAKRSSALGFLEVLAPPRPASPPAIQAVEVSLPSGVRLRVPVDVECDRLRDLLAVVEARS